MLLTGGSLLARSFANLLDRDLGFDVEGVGTVEAPLDGHYEQDRWADFWPQIEARLRPLPGVAAVGFTNAVPTDESSAGFIEVEGYDDPRAGDGHRVVSHGYFDAIGVEVLAGRAFGPEDREGTARVAVVNRVRAERYWPGESPVGGRVKAYSHEGSNWGDPDSAPWLTVVGVVDDVRQGGAADEEAPELFVSLRQVPLPWHLSQMVTVVRGEPGVQAGTLVRPVREAFREQDPRLAVGVRTMRDRVSTLLFRTRLTRLNYRRDIYGTRSPSRSSCPMRKVTSGARRRGPQSGELLLRENPAWTRGGETIEGAVRVSMAPQRRARVRWWVHETAVSIMTSSRAKLVMGARRIHNLAPRALSHHRPVACNRSVHNRTRTGIFSHNVADCGYSSSRGAQPMHRVTLRAVIVCGLALWPAGPLLAQNGQARWRGQAQWELESFVTDDPAWSDWHRVDAGVGYHSGGLTLHAGGLSSRRFGVWDTGILVDVYHSLWEGAYGNVRVQAVPEAAIAPSLHASIELFQGFGGPWEGALGYRRMSFTNAEVDLLTAGLARYTGPWYLRGKAFAVELAGERALSFMGLARLYLSEAPEDLLELTFAGGKEVETVGPEGVVDLRKSAALGLFGRKWVSDRVGLSLAGGYSSLERTPSRVRVSVGALTRF